MRSTQVLLCLGALGALMILCSDSAASPGGVNCRRFVYHPVCRGVAAKRSDLPTVTAHRHEDDFRKQAFHPMCRGVQVKRGTPIAPHHLHYTTLRKHDEEGPDAEYVPVPVNVDVSGETPPRRALWNYLADRPANILLAHRKLDPETFELTYDYE